MSAPPRALDDDVEPLPEVERGRWRAALARLRRLGRARMQGSAEPGESGGSAAFWRAVQFLVIAAAGMLGGWGQQQLRPEPPAPVPVLGNGNGAQVAELGRALTRIEQQLAGYETRAQRNAEEIARVQAELTARAEERAARFLDVERAIGVLVERASDVEATLRELQRTRR